jgi:hypothetical protein
MSNRWAIATVLGLAAFLTGAAADESGPRQPANSPPGRDTAGPAPGVAMNNHYLDGTLRAMTDEIEGGEGRWVLTWFDVELLVISDENADRMRVIALIDNAAELDKDQLQFLLEVNFERALDAKYTIWQDQVWATFVHPLSWLSPDELKAGARQVVSLFHTYGTEFTSTGMSFSPATREDEGGN